MFEDANGKHYVLFSKNKHFYKEKNPDQFSEDMKQEWILHDSVSCNGLDISGNFIHRSLKVVDPLNSGKKSVVFGYKMACRGGVDPQEFKVVYRNAAGKVILRGLSLIEYSGSSSGGEYEENDGFKSADPKIQKVLIDTWDKFKKD